MSLYSADLTLAVCNSLVDKLVQLLRLLFPRDGARDRIAYDVTVLINHICDGIRIQPRSEFSGLAVGFKPDIFV